VVTGSTPHDGDARILIVDDHAIIAQSLSQTMAALGMVVQVAGDLSQDGVVGLAQRFQPHVVLLDLYLDRTESIPFIAPLTSGGAKVVMLTGSTNRGILGECVEAGAVAVIGKGHGLSVLVDAVRNALTGATLLEDYERGELLEAARSRRAAEADRMKPFDALTNREQQVLAALHRGQDGRGDRRAGVRLPRHGPLAHPRRAAEAGSQLPAGRRHRGPPPRVAGLIPVRQVHQS
jgi:NarL family two-component system response regulator LiaR